MRWWRGSASRAGRRSVLRMVAVTDVAIGRIKAAIAASAPVSFARDGVRADGQRGAHGRVEPPARRHGRAVAGIGAWAVDSLRRRPPAFARTGQIWRQLDAGYFAGQPARAALLAGVEFAIGARRIAQSAARRRARQWLGRRDRHAQCAGSGRRLRGRRRGPAVHPPSSARSWRWDKLPGPAHPRRHPGLLLPESRKPGVKDQRESRDQLICYSRNRA